MNKRIIILKIEDLPNVECNLFNMNVHENDLEKFFSLNKNQITFKNEKIINNRFEYETLCSLNKYVKNVDNQEKFKIDLNRINGISFPVKLPPYYTFNFRVFNLFNKYKDKEIKIVYLED